MRRVLFLVNHDVVIYNFRLEIVERFIKESYEVHISSPYGERIDDLSRLGCVYHAIDISRHGVNPLKDLKLLAAYKRLMREVKPLIVFGFTIKPNLYGAIAARRFKIPFIANITGLGTAVENPGVMQTISILLYKFAFTDVRKVFFQNTENRQFFVDHGIALGRHDLLPGSGVNLDRFSPLPYPSGEETHFAFISRIMQEKGIDQYLEAAAYIREKYPRVFFHVAGFCESDYKGRLDRDTASGTIVYHGMVRNVREILSITHCVIHPTYYPEGLSNVLLEACACARPIITTDRSGCREVIDDGLNGFVVKQEDSADLIAQIEKFLSLSLAEKGKMGLAGRAKVERLFDRQIIVNKYLSEAECVEGITRQASHARRERA